MNHPSLALGLKWFACLLALPLAGAAWAATAQSDAPQPRIAVMARPNGAAFTLKGSGVPLLIKGFNYFPLRGGDHATFDAATRTTTANYDPQRAERMFTALEAAGFNTVRVFIIGRLPAMNPGIAGNQDTLGLYQPYMDNVLDFLRRARHHGIHVLPAFGDGELPSNRYYQSMLNPNHRESPNSIYFTKEGIAAKVRYVSDFLNDIKTRDPALLSSLMGIECQGEMCVYDNQWPFTVRQGILEMPNGKSYDMANRTQRWALMNEGLRFYLQAVVQAVKHIDPEMLVGESIFTREAVGKPAKYRDIRPAPYRDHRYPPDLVSLGEGAVDFLDIHYYHLSLKENLIRNFHLHMHSSLLDTPAMARILNSKPLILGEFGEYRYKGSAPAEVAVNMVALRELALAAGFQGFLYWTYDTIEQKEFHQAMEDNGILIKALAIPGAVPGAPAPDTNHASAP